MLLNHKADIHNNGQYKIELIDSEFSCSFLVFGSNWNDEFELLIDVYSKNGYNKNYIANQLFRYMKQLEKGSLLVKLKELFSGLKNKEYLEIIKKYLLLE